VTRLRPLACAVVAVLALVAVAAAPAAAPAQGRSAPAEVSLNGSNTLVPLLADLVFYYRRAVPRPPHFTLHGSSTPTGVGDAARGIATIGLAARGPDEADPPGLVFMPLAFSGVCLVTNVRNPVAGATRAQIQEIVAGRRTTWAGIPGAGLAGEIVKAGLEPGLAGEVLFRETFVDPETPLVGFRAFATFRAVRAFVLATPGAAAYVDFAFQRGLHAVPYEGVPCTRATIASGAYPARRQLSLVTRGRPRGAAARFMRWLRTSAVARRVIATRYVPAR
jgi:phosphate transport system substrate-binding protein